MEEQVQFAAYVQELLELLHSNDKLEDFKGAFSEDEDLEEFATRAKFLEFQQGTQVVKQGERGDSFFIVMEGQLRGLDVSKPRPRLLSYLAKGAIFGTPALLSNNRQRTATVEVVTYTVTLAVFDEDDWSWLMGKDSRFETLFENIEKNRIEQSHKEFPGRQWDEVVVAATKRHYTAYIASIHTPIILLIIPIIFFLAARLLGVDFDTTLSLVVMIGSTLFFATIAIFLAVYNYLDWRNDDFIVTTKRVVHIERILFFGEQREDAPLTRIQDVTLISDVLDLIFDSDTVRMTTAGAGVIEFNHIRNADLIREAIFRERERAKARVAAGDVAALRHSIAQQIHWEDPLETNVIPVAEADGMLVHQPRTYHYHRLIDYFIPRIKEVNEVDGGTTVIIWRKHYYVLFMNVALPLMVLLISTYLFLSSLFAFVPPSFDAGGWIVRLGLFVAMGASLLWYLVKYDDWIKDLYMVTDSQIIDIESAAFRVRKTRREGTFDNIQSVYSNISNLFYKLINLGDVVIETAGSEETFTFRKVFDPASVREEIFNRWAIYQQMQREAQRDATHKQVMEVIKEYHDIVSKSAG